MKDTKEEEAHRHSRWLLKHDYLYSSEHVYSVPLQAVMMERTLWLLHITTCTVLKMFIRLHAGSDDGDDAMAS